MLYALTPYLQFDGNAAEVIEFYQSALDGKIINKTLYSEIPHDDDDPMPADFLDKYKDKVCHSEMYIGKFLIMVADGCPPNTPNHGDQIALTLSSDDVEETAKYFNAIKEGAKIRMPLAKTFWSPLFGSLVDKYGITWSFNTLSKEEIDRIVAAKNKIID